eukprot:2412458-Amphidinium_carterae.1
MARIGALGRYLAIKRAVEPVSVKATMSLQLESTQTLTAEEQTLSTASIDFIKLRTANLVEM